MNNIIEYLKNEYNPLAIICYGSFIFGDNDEYSDFDCMLIVKEKTRRHDDSFVDGIKLDCFIYTQKELQTEDIDSFLMIYDGDIIFDTDNIALNLKKEVNKYICEHSYTTREEKKFIISWTEKTINRVKKGDDEGNFRALQFLSGSLSDYFTLRDMFYFGSKKAVSYLIQNDDKGYKLYHNAITSRTNEAISLWGEYVIKIDL